MQYEQLVTRIADFGNCRIKKARFVPGLKRRGSELKSVFDSSSVKLKQINQIKTKEMEPRTRTLFNQPLKQLLQCFVKSLLDYCFSHVSSFLQPVATQLKNSKMLAATRNFLASLVASLTLRLGALAVRLKEGWTNRRFLTGAIIFLLALPAWKFHLLFDVNVRSEEWYWQNLAFFFNNIKWILILFFVMIGGFIAMPQKWSFRWWALPIAFFAATEIYDRYFYDDYLDFQQELPDWRVCGILALCVPAVLFSLDYLAYRKYHLKDGNAARILGVAKMKGVPAEVKMELMEKLALEAETFNERI